MDLINKEILDKYYEITKKSLWLSQQKRPDLQLVMGFYYAYIRNTNGDNLDKLK